MEGGWIPFPCQVWDKLATGLSEGYFLSGIFSALSSRGFYVRIGFKAIVCNKNERKQNQYFSAGPP
jgi:hypothetical protein